MKYKLGDKHPIRDLYRVVALKDFGGVKEGDVGGYVQSIDNLNQIGDCWVYDNARVCDNAAVCDNAMVIGNARISGEARISGGARVSGDTRVDFDLPRREA